MSLKVYPIPLCIAPAQMREFLYFSNQDKPTLLVNYMWYVEGSSYKVIIDGGVDIAFLKGLGLFAVQINEIEEALRKLNIELGDIDLIIATHLHFDHIGLAHRFPKAKVLIQEKELKFANNPHPYLSGGYFPQFFCNLKFEVVNGDQDICEGISVLFTPGHTFGGQSVILKGKSCSYAIDCFCTFKENYQKSKAPRSEKEVCVTIPSFHINVIETYESMLRLKASVDHVIPCHEPEFMKVQVIEII